MKTAALLDEPPAPPVRRAGAPPPRGDGWRNIAFIALWVLLTVVWALGAAR